MCSLIKCKINHLKLPFVPLKWINVVEQFEVKHTHKSSKIINKLHENCV